jgi:hypothetical protein
MTNLLWHGDAMLSSPATVKRHKEERNERFVVTSRDDDILDALATYSLLTADRITRLFYSPGSLTRVQTLLKRLADAGYIGRRSFHPYDDQPNKWTHVYYLARKGVQYLRSTGREYELRRRPSEDRAVTDYHTHHELMTIDVAIAARLLGQRMDGVQLARWESDRQLKGRQLKVNVLAGREPKLVTEQMEPDSLLEFAIAHHGQPTRVVIALETDCDTEEQKRWKAKIRRHVAWATTAGNGTSSPFATVFGPGRPLVAVVVAPRKTRRAEPRCHTLLEWTEQELTALGRRDEAERFVFTYLSPTTEPVKLFLGATSWYRPFEEAAFPLLAGLTSATTSSA